MTAGILGLIPARGGSVGVPGKNIRDLGGKPLIVHTIEAALESGALERVIVATDDELIAEAARSCGAETPFLRPPEISGSHSPMFDIYHYTLDWLKTHEAYEPDILCTLLCTLPFRNANHIKEAMARMVENNHDWLFSINAFEEHPYRGMVLEGARMRPMFDIPTEKIWANRQDLPPVYRFNGAILAGRAKHILSADKYVITHDDGSLMNIGYLLLGENEAYDIDTEFDFTIAEFLIAQKKRSRASDSHLPSSLLTT